MKSPVGYQRDSHDGKTIKRIEEPRCVVKATCEAGTSIAFVPIIGFLHEGDLALIRGSMSCCDLTMAGIFVRSGQFGPNERLDCLYQPA
jgi:pantoate--beta-alanine ligase